MIRQLLFIITEYLDDKSKIELLKCSTNTYKIIDKVTFNDMYEYEKIKDLKYYDNMTKIMVKKVVKFPLKIKKIKFDDDFNEEITEKLSNNKIIIGFGLKYDKDINTLFLLNDIKEIMIYRQFQGNIFCMQEFKDGFIQSFQKMKIMKKTQIMKKFESSFKTSKTGKKDIYCSSFKVK